MSIRDAEVTDAPALAHLAEATFRAAFGGSNTAENLRLHCERSYGEAIQRREIGDPRMETLLAWDGTELTGYAQLRWGGDLPAVGQEPSAEIQRLYVDAAWHGRGVAPALMAEALRRARRRGATQVWLGVWEHNPRAIAFYRKQGFSVVGEQVFRLGEEPQRDLVMARPLGNGGESDRSTPRMTGGSHR